MKVKICSTSGKDERSDKQDKPSLGTSNAAKPSEATRLTTPVETSPPTNRQAKADQVLAQINAYRQQNGKELFYKFNLPKRQI